jgi:hypothetical protein
MTVPTPSLTIASSPEKILGSSRTASTAFFIHEYWNTNVSGWGRADLFKLVQG